MKIWKVRLHIIFKEVFQYTLIAYLILLFAEMLKPGLVSYFLNLNILLTVIMLSGAAMVLTYNEKLDDLLKNKEHHKIRTSDIEYIVILTSVGSFITWFYTQNLDILAIVLSVIIAIIIVLLSIIVLTYKDN